MLPLLLLACARSTAPVAAVDPTVGPINLWRVQRGDAVSHLFGTCHLPIPVIELLPPPHDGVLDQARVVLNELDVRDLSQADPLRTLSILHSETSVRDQLGEAAWEDYIRSARGVPAPMLDHLQPWFGSDSSTAPEHPPVDVAAQARLVAGGASLVSLETLEQQLQLLEHLVQGDTPSTAMTDSRELANTCCFEPDPAGCSAAVDGMPEPERRLLFDERNRSWMPTLLPELEAGGAVVAVGAGHMVGEAGLVRLLEMQGFTVEQLSGIRSSRPTVVEAPPEPPDPRRVEAWTTGIDVALQTACALPPFACLVAEVPDCPARLARDYQACVVQRVDRLRRRPTGAEDPAIAELLQCSVSGLMLDFIVTGPHSEACADAHAKLVGRASGILE